MPDLPIPRFGTPSNQTGKQSLDLGAKRSVGGTPASVSNVSALSSAFGSKDESKDTSDANKNKGEDGKSESKAVEQVQERGRSDTIHVGREENDGKRQDLSVPPLERKTSSSSVQQSSSPSRDVSTPNPAPTPTNVEEVPEEDKLRILRRHLVSAEERKGSTSEHQSGFQSFPRSRNSSKAASMMPDFKGDNGNGVTPGESVFLNDEDPGASAFSRNSYSRNSADEAEEADAFPIPYDALGADVTHGIYKYQQTHAALLPGRRSLSFSAVQRDSSLARDLDPSLQHLNEPGGMRRHYVIHRAVARGEDQPVVLRSFVDFLFLYGHFAGEDLDEDEDFEDLDEEAHAHVVPASVLHQRMKLTREETAALDERAPLLRNGTRGMSVTRLKRGKSVGKTGDATVTQAVLMLLKGFVGTGVLFLGKAFFNGGILFSAIVMLAIAGISLWSFLLLVKTRLVIPGSFGDIGGTLYGSWMRQVILTSIALSQVGFVCAYTIFVAENLQAFVLGVTKGKSHIPIKYLILSQLLVVLPLSMIRNLAALSSTALIADAFILIGLVYIGTNEVTTIVKEGVANVALFNSKDFSLLIGTAVFAFEGIGLIIPITEAMKEPHRFPKALTGVMIGVATLFTGFGVMGYAAYGPDIQTVVIVNLPQDDKFVQVVQFLYTVAIVLSLPLQLFPAVRIWENGLFVRSGKHDSKVKWQKNIFRASVVILCSLISWAGASNLDGFVSFIGSFACVPLCFIYPPMLHLRARAKTRTQKVMDIGLIVFGIITTIYTTFQTIRVLVR